MKDEDAGPGGGGEASPPHAAAASADWAQDMAASPTSSRSVMRTVNGSHRFVIQGYSLAKGMGVGKHITSETFAVGGYQGVIYFYPDGKIPADNSAYLSVFIALPSEDTDVRELFELTLVNQSGKGKHMKHSHFDRSPDSSPYTLKHRGSMWWTFILVTIYFGLGTALSIYGCSKFADENAVVASTDMELGTNYTARGAATAKPIFDEEDGAREIAGFWGYLLQIIYQANAGAVMLTDCVFWFIIFPFLTIKDYNLNFLLIGMHSVNAVFLLGEAALNSLRFPWFRIAYFFLWTALYVIFQWIVHAATPIWWPYPFLDLSSNFSPLWYLAVAVMQIPCYVVFRLVIKLKHNLLVRWFPVSFVRG